MIEFNGLAHIGIRVADFKRSVRFYRQFGFKVIREDINERVVVLQHEQDLELNLLDSASK
ncbi:MAG: VOC family protein [Pseudomonadota bacterium]